MRQFFPVLDRHPSLLFVCWIRRDFRFLKKVVSGGFRRFRLKISIRFSDWKEALVQRIVREDDENSKKINGEEFEGPEDMPESEDSEEGESSSERENLSRTS